MKHSRYWLRMNPERPALRMRFGDGAGELVCPICGRVLPLFYYKPVIGYRRTLQRYFSGRPNAERHLDACFRRKLDERTS